MSDEHQSDGRESFESHDADSLHPELPFGMAGVTAMLDRLRVGVENAERGEQHGWTRSRCHAVADYLLSLHSEYWFSGEELEYCRRIVAN
jgi:hypothetical protein